MAASDLYDGQSQRFLMHADDRATTVDALLLTQWQKDCVLQVLLLESDEAGRVALSRVYTPKNGVTTRTLDDPASSWRVVLTERSGLVFNSVEETARPDVVGTVMAKGPAAVNRTISIPGESPLALTSTTFDSDDASVAQIVREASARDIPARLGASAPRRLALQLSLLRSMLDGSREGVPGLLEFAPIITSLQGLLAAPSPADRVWQRFAGLTWQFEGHGVHPGVGLAGDDLSFASNFGLPSPRAPLKGMEAGCTQRP